MIYGGFLCGLIIPLSKGLTFCDQLFCPYREVVLLRRLLAERARMRERSHNQVIKMEICDGYMVRAILP